MKGEPGRHAVRHETDCAAPESPEDDWSRSEGRQETGFARPPAMRYIVKVVPAATDPSRK